MEKPSVKIHLSKHASLTQKTHTHNSQTQKAQMHTITNILVCCLLNSKWQQQHFPSSFPSRVQLSSVEAPCKPQHRSPYVGKQMPQHSIQISRQSDDSQQASIMPQSMSQGQLQSSPMSSVQQQQQQASEVHVPHEAWATTMLQSVRNSQNRQARMQWTQQSSGKGGFCEPVELPLLRRLLSLLTDKLDRNFRCILCDTGVDGCFLGCSVVADADVIILAPGPDTPMLPALMLAPQEHKRVAPAPLMPGWIPLPLLKVGVPVLLWWKSFWSSPSSLSAGSEGTGWGSDWGWILTGSQ